MQRVNVGVNRSQRLPDSCLNRRLHFRLGFPLAQLRRSQLEEIREDAFRDILDIEHKARRVARRSADVREDSVDGRMTSSTENRALMQGR